ncbi:MAG: LysM peptidoglycan-binding domain-containing protein [Phototrophicaceae bacterium]
MTLRSLIMWLLAGVLLSPALVLAQETTPEPNLPIGLTIHVVQRDENLFRIALNYNTSVAELVELNGLNDATRIDIGQRLLVPADTLSEVLPQTHIVQPGETLLTIANLYNLDLDTLTLQNEITDINSIYVGQILNITPTLTVAAEVPVAPTPAPINVASDDSLPTVSGNIHVVAQGETLFRIATGYGLTTQELAQANSILDPTVIYAGQQLIIPNLPESQISASDLPTPIQSLSVQPLIFIEGETGVITLTSDISTIVSGTFLGRNLAFIGRDDNTRHIAFLGIPVFTESGVYTVDLSLANGDGSQTTFAFNVRVVGGGYGSQNLDVTNENLTAPAVQDNELSLLTNITSIVTLNRAWDAPFSIPAAAAMNASYGTLRSYNGGPISAYHSGADFAAAPNTPIYAAASGVVVLADTLNIRGNTIVIDHGWGIYTAYAHQTSLTVGLGEMVTTGQIIGTAGATGRVTGPHLHWEVWINGVPVNPITWTQQIFPS